jgi:hypothetical protein
MNAIPDSEILKSIHDRLQRAGASQERIRATLDHGSVKLMGSLQFEMQRRAYLKVVSAIAAACESSHTEPLRALSCLPSAEDLPSQSLLLH